MHVYPLRLSRVMQWRSLPWAILVGWSEIQKDCYSDHMNFILNNRKFIIFPELNAIYIYNAAKFEIKVWTYNILTLTWCNQCTTTSNASYPFKCWQSHSRIKDNNFYSTNDTNTALHTRWISKTHTNPDEYCAIYRMFIVAPVHRIQNSQFNKPVFCSLSEIEKC